MAYLSPHSTLSLSLVFGLVGSLTPCALGINAVFLGTVAGRPRAVRAGQWLLFALARAVFLTLLGLLFGLLGAAVGDFVRGYQKVIAVGLIVLGALLMLSRWQRVPWSALNLPVGAREPARGGPPVGLVALRAGGRGAGFVGRWYPVRASFSSPAGAAWRATSAGRFTSATQRLDAWPDGTIEEFVWRNDVQIP